MQQNDNLNRYNVTDGKPVRFPCERFPENPSLARLLGVYPQRPEGLFMQRVKAPAGRLTLEQWQGLAALAARYTPEYPLHVTTRQNLELHGVRKDDLPALQRGIDSLGLTGAAACGDSVRNITVCPRNECCPGTWDVSELVRAIRTAVESLPWRENLPRKFKISVSGCREACGRPWINDLGLVANPDGDFRVILAGSLAQNPTLGCLSTTPCRSEMYCLWLWLCSGCSMRKVIAPTGPARGCVICGNDWVRKFFGVAWMSVSR